MSLVIVPNALSDAINAKLDMAYQDQPEAAVDRDLHYRALLEYFADHGVIPEFKITKGE